MRPTVTHILVTDSTAEEVERRTGFRGRDTSRGVLLEAADTFDISKQLARLERHLNPNRCTCGRYAIIHRPGCPAWGIST